MATHTDRRQPVAGGRAALWFATAALICMICVGCHDGRAPEGTIVRACGQAISTVPPSAVYHLNKIRDMAGGAILVLVSNCAHGVDVTISPPTFAAVIASITADDGKYVAVELEFRGGLGIPGVHGTLTATQGQKVVGEIGLGASPVRDRSATT